MEPATSPSVSAAAKPTPVPPAPIPLPHEADEERDVRFGTPSPNAPTPIERHRIVVRVQRSALAAKWLVTCFVLLLAVIWGAAGTPFCRPFEWDDADIAHPYHDNTFPDWSLVPIGASPSLLGLVLCWATPMYPEHRWWELHELVFANLITSALTEVMTDPAKLFAGRLRPDFLSRLKMAGFNSSMIADYCAVTADDKDLREGRLSFPSGHSSTAFGAMVLMCLIVLNRLRAFRQPDFRVAYFVVGICPLAFAFTVALSRTRDNRHHFADIVAGALIGTVSALLAFKLQYTYCTKRLAFVPQFFTERESLPPVVVEELQVIV